MLYMYIVQCTYNILHAIIFSLSKSQGMLFSCGVSYVFLILILIFFIKVFNL